VPNLRSVYHKLESNYLPLIKGRQTALLMLTGLAGYLSAYPFPIHIGGLVHLMGTLFLTISGSTIINMWFDRDIDAKMLRTCHRPLVTGQVKASESLFLGLALLVLGLGWSLSLSVVYTSIALVGIFFEIVIYTFWLKRRTAWSILLGGLAGGMPILGGRALAMGEVDRFGLLLALIVLLWIPTHNLSFAILRLDDYQRAGVPTFPSVYGSGATYRLIAFSSLLLAIIMTMFLIGMELVPITLYVFIGFQVGLVGLALMAWFRSSAELSAGLFRYATIYLFCCMFVVAVNAF
jgi:protoheme IX farnesyltransferase